jgi:hypothetical protein
MTNEIAADKPAPLSSQQQYHSQLVLASRSTNGIIIHTSRTIFLTLGAALLLSNICCASVLASQSPSSHRLLEFGTNRKAKSSLRENLLMQLLQSHTRISFCFLLCLGDFAEDVPEECPATTSCPVVCVANLASCPTPLCTAGLTLCRTGHCAVDCSIHNTAYRNPCETCDSLSVACPKVIDAYPNCRERFDTFYNAHDSCVAAQVESVPKISFWGPWFATFHAGFAALFVVVTAWCWYNERYHPMESLTTHEFVVPNGTLHEKWRIAGALVVTYFQYQNDCLLYKLTQVEGSVEYVMVLQVFA